MGLKCNIWKRYICTNRYSSGAADAGAPCRMGVRNHEFCCVTLSINMLKLVSGGITETCFWS